MPLSLQLAICLTQLMFKYIVVYLFCRIMDDMIKCLDPIKPNCNMDVKVKIQNSEQEMDYVCHKQFSGEEFVLWVVYMFSWVTLFGPFVSV